MYNGKIEKKIGKVKRLFWFNPNVFIEFGKRNGINPDDVDGVNKTYEKINITGQKSMEMFREICFLGLKNSKNDLPDNYSLELVGEWIADMEFEDFMEVIDCFIEASSLSPLMGVNNTDEVKKKTG